MTRKPLGGPGRLIEMPACRPECSKHCSARRLGAPVSPVLQRNAAPAYPRLENRREVTPYQGSIAPAPLEVEKPRTRSRRALPLPLPVAAGPGAEGLSREHAYGNEACYHGQNA